MHPAHDAEVCLSVRANRLCWHQAGPCCAAWRDLMDAVPLSQPSAFCPEVGLRHLAVTLAVIMPFEREWLPVGWVSLCIANLANPRVLRRFSELAWRPEQPAPSKQDSTQISGIMAQTQNETPSP